jgi:GntR family transcriptional regulator/MocR family aminotransferase
VAIAQRAQQRGVLTRPLSHYYARGGAQRGLLLGYACVQEEQIAPAFEVLLGCLG